MAVSWKQKGTKASGNPQGPVSQPRSTPPPSHLSPLGDISESCQDWLPGRHRHTCMREALLLQGGGLRSEELLPGHWTKRVGIWPGLVELGAQPR